MRLRRRRLVRHRRLARSCAPHRARRGLVQLRRRGSNARSPSRSHDSEAEAGRAGTLHLHPRDEPPRRFVRRRRRRTPLLEPTSSRSLRRRARRLAGEEPRGASWRRIAAIAAELCFARRVLVTGGLDGLWSAVVAAGAEPSRPRTASPTPSSRPGRPRRGRPRRARQAGRSPRRDRRLRRGAGPLGRARLQRRALPRAAHHHRTPPPSSRSSRASSPHTPGRSSSSAPAKPA